jgi:cytochrome P450
MKHLLVAPSNNDFVGRLNPIIYAEVDQVMREDIPECQDWTPVSAYMTVVNMVAKVTGRIFVGPELCRHPDYLDSAINYAIDVLKAQKEIKFIRPFLRPFLAPRLESIQQLREREKKAANFFEPIVQARLDAEANDPHYQRPDDMMSSFMSSGGDRGAVLAPELAKMQLGVIFAAVHTTSEAMTHM